MEVGETWKIWPLRCPECGDQVIVEAPVSDKEPRTGTTECASGHPITYKFDGVTLVAVESRDKR